MAPTAQETHDRKVKALVSLTKSKHKRTKGRVVRYLKSTEAVLEEKTARKVLLLKGIRCSNNMSEVLRDLKSMQQPNSKLLSKNNEIMPFEDEGCQSLEFLCTKNDCSLFALASHSKKRPNNLILGRTFDRHVLDIYELGLHRYRSIKSYKLAPKKRLNSKPMLAFLGDVWNIDSQYTHLRSFFVDFFKGTPVEKIVLNGLDHIVSFSAVQVDEQVIIYMRSYFVKLKKNPDASSSTPIPFLVNCGPDIDFSLRRTQPPSTDLWRLAIKQPKEIKAKKKKNKSTNLFGETIAKLHIQKQDIDKLQGKRSKALRIAGKVDDEAKKKQIDDDLKREKEGMDQEFKMSYGFEQE